MCILLCYVLPILYILVPNNPSSSGYQCVSQDARPGYVVVHPMPKGTCVHMYSIPSYKEYFNLQHNSLSQLVIV